MISPACHPWRLSGIDSGDGDSPGRPSEDHLWLRSLRRVSEEIELLILPLPEGTTPETVGCSSGQKGHHTTDMSKKQTAACLPRLSFRLSCLGESFSNVISRVPSNQQ